MEAEIKRIIEADLRAQNRLQEAQSRIETALKNVQKEKSAVQAEVWNEAKQKLDDERKRLENDFESNKTQSQAKYNEAIAKIEARFNEKRDVWLKELIDRCLNEGNRE